MTPIFILDTARIIRNCERDPAVIAAIHTALGQLAAESRKPKTRKERLPWNTVQEAIEKAGPRRIRLFACALVRELGDAVPPALRPLIDVAESYADGLVTKEELQLARQEAENHLPSRRWNTPEQVLLSGRWLPEECVWTLLREDSYTIALHGLRRAVGARKFQPIFFDVMLPPDSGLQMSGDCIRLAESMYNGGECGFALHDALLEAGQTALAVHFATVGRHWRGCWAVDSILGKGDIVQGT